MTNGEIVDILARERRVETMVKAIFHRDTLTDDLADLCQIVYIILLQYSPDKISDLWENGQIGFFIARLIKTQRDNPYERWHKDTHLFLDETLNIDDIKDL